mmetsp:Transcript_29623/g.70608  ORF Transcript_29623/g.70608 Transcript_29623/m.70608 type:complete len:308 (-) Transcript_29623:834-1757(-)
MTNAAGAALRVPVLLSPCSKAPAEKTKPAFCGNVSAAGTPAKKVDGREVAGAGFSLASPHAPEPAQGLGTPMDSERGTGKAPKAAGGPSSPGPAPPLATPRASQAWLEVAAVAVVPIGSQSMSVAGCSGSVLDPAAAAADMSAAKLRGSRGSPGNFASWEGGAPGCGGPWASSARAPAPWFARRRCDPGARRALLRGCTLSADGLALLPPRNTNAPSPASPASPAAPWAAVAAAAPSATCSPRAGCLPFAASLDPPPAPLGSFASGDGNQNLSDGGNFESAMLSMEVWWIFSARDAQMCSAAAAPPR